MRLNKTQQTRLDNAKYDFANLYLNTGADWDEACDHADFMWNQAVSETDNFENALTRLSIEGERYRDM